MKNILVNVWEESVVIPTYQTGKPNKNPMFFEKRIYQGSSGVVYPNPIVEKIYDDKVDQEYIGLFLENPYIKMMILPELGGRIQMAYDKVKERHFVYYNQVIKPALVGLTGPWISGGIEFNWPQHHRPSTFDATEYRIVENNDGSKSVFVNEIERMFHMKGTTEFVLYPDKAYIEIKTRLLNRTALPQTFLWWANPAVKANNYYQSVFPSDVNAVFDHGKRDVSTFPIATGTYYKVDYSPGTDISFYKNIPVPTSYMAINSDYDFVGGYEHDTNGGLLHVANHHVSPGKKQWTWGNGDFGKAWDKNLTDEDGPYVELMTGMYTDNQPDFTWLMPNEEKSFTQYFLPYRDLGLVKNASKDILVATDIRESGVLGIKVYGTSLQEELRIELSDGEKVIHRDTFSISPHNVYSTRVPVSVNADEKDFTLILFGFDGHEILRYEPSENRKNELPNPAEAALLPEEITSVEELFLTGQHLEQYRHATYSPIPYYEAALQREPGDIRCNNALGLWYLRRGKFLKSEPYFRRAIATSTRRNPNPYDGEPYYNLGLVLKYTDRLKESYEAFYKAGWNYAWKHSAHLNLAMIDMINGSYQSALENIDIAISHNTNNSKAYLVKVATYRILGMPQIAKELALHALENDSFNLSLIHELIKLNLDLGDLVETEELIYKLKVIANGKENNLLEYSLDYADMGLFQEAISFLSYFDIEKNTSPMLFYYLGHFYGQLGDDDESLKMLNKAECCVADHCFPNRLQEVIVLNYAITTNPKGSKAPYYLGCLFYDKRQHNEAIALWEQSAELNLTFPTVFRNLGIAAYNKQNDTSRALAYYEKAFSLDPSDDRICMELHQLYKRTNMSPTDRLKFLMRNWEVVVRRDDLFLEVIEVHIFQGDYEKALELIMDRKFHPWEGGEGKISMLYVTCLVQLAVREIDQHNYRKGIELLEKAQTYPENLGEGKLYNARENNVFYYLGRAYDGLDESKLANFYYRKAAEGNAKPTAAVFYNDQQPDMIFYQGMALKMLENHEEARFVFNELINYGKAHMTDDVKMDYFAVSLPDLIVFDDDLYLRNRIHCHFVQGMGYLGIGRDEESNREFEKVLSLNRSHLGAKLHTQFEKQGI